MHAKWPNGRYVCKQCEKQLQAKHFSPTSNICFACHAHNDSNKLAKKLKERSATRETPGQRLKRKRGHVKHAQKVQAKQRAELNRERKKEKAKADKIVERRKKVLEEQMSTEERAERELASRELAKRSLLHYVERNVKGYEAGWVHEDICRRLEKFVKDVEERRSPRLMLWVPPRHGKSEIASIQFPSWVLGKHPEWEFITASYSADLPLKFSRKIRGQIQSTGYQQLFPRTRLSKDSTAAEHWLTSEDGGYRAGSVKVGITGMGAHILSIDDPVKDASEADSETARQVVWDWFGSTAYSRLAPGGGILVIQTRWHDDDLSGRLETAMTEGMKEWRAMQDEVDKARARMRSERDRREVDRMQADVDLFKHSIDQWEIISYPAIAIENESLCLRTGDILKGTIPEEQVAFTKPLRKKGDALHPDRFPLPLLAKYKRTLEPRHWSALYQQDPAPDEGAIFTEEMFRYQPLPDWREMHTYAAWDLAISQRQTGDWTVGVVGALDWNGKLWILDMVRDRWDITQICENILDVSSRYNCLLTGIEKGVLEAAVMPELSRMMQEPDRPTIAIADGDDALRPITDKVVRCRPLQGQMQTGRVIFPKDQPWVDLARAELLRFPSGIKDDIVDALSWLARLTSGRALPPDPVEVARRSSRKVKGWRERLKERDRIGGRRNYMSR